MGVINEVVEPDELMDTAFAWARRITANAPLAVRAAKQSALLGMRSTLAEAMVVEDEIGGSLFQTQDAQEGTSAFLEKRAPVWQAR